MAKSRWSDDVTGRRIETAAALGADEAAAVKERGRARDLEATSGELLLELAEVEEGWATAPERTECPVSTTPERRMCRGTGGSTPERLRFGR